LAIDLHALFFQVMVDPGVSIMRVPCFPPFRRSAPARPTRSSLQSPEHERALANATQP
jgi:hypothetical protein